MKLSKVFDYSVIALLMITYLYIWRYSVAHPEFMMYDPESELLDPNLPPYLDCNLEPKEANPHYVPGPSDDAIHYIGKDRCKIYNLPQSSKEVWVIKDNPFVYYSSTYSWVVLLIVTLLCSRCYWHRKGWQEFKGDMRSIKKLLTPKE